MSATTGKRQERHKGPLTCWTAASATPKELVEKVPVRPTASASTSSARRSMLSGDSRHQLAETAIERLTSM
jgi:hypothetical protein